MEPLDEQVRVVLGDDEGRAQLEDVVVRAVGAGEHAALAQALDDVDGLRRGRLQRLAVPDELDPEEQARPAEAGAA